MNDKRWWLLVAMLTIVAIVRVASTHRVFSITIDEPAHLGDGDRWFDGKCAGDPSHPPLARVLCALPLRIAGVPPATNDNEIARGHAVLAYGDYDARLALARRGNLVLLAIAIIATAAWARRAFSRGTALLAAAIFTTLPPVLAHAGLITTDMAVTATVPLALLALDMALEKPSLARWLALGAAIGLGLLSKLSFLVYFPAGALVVILLNVTWGQTPRYVYGFAAAITAFFVLWAGYRFTVDSPSDLSKDAVFVFHHAAPEPLVPLARRIAQTPMPAPSFALGVATLAWRAKNIGHPSYFLGETRTMGWWDYFPVLLFYKSPLPFLVFVFWGIAFIRSREQLAYALIALAILLVAMSASLHVGIRHILPIYAPLSILAAHGAMEIGRRAAGAFSRAALIALIAWLFIGTAIAHPDYLAWFNELAGENPAWIAVDSNLDWGQDAGRLVLAARELHIETLHVALLAAIRFELYGVHAELLQPYEKKSGWIAVSDTVLATNAEGYRWLSLYRPARRIGKSIRLYFIP